LRQNYGTDRGHTDRKQQDTITTVKRNLNDKSQVSNGEIQFTRKCVNLVMHINFTAVLQKPTFDQ